MTSLSVNRKNDFVSLSLLFRSCLFVNSLYSHKKQNQYHFLIILNFQSASHKKTHSSLGKGRMCFRGSTLVPIQTYFLLDCSSSDNG
ncbi:hypothetical protein BCN_1885 [Bacillus cereus NC7401]|nr:hypothetical protein BCN_1885 [Bacillus cereus NC7401]